MHKQAQLAATLVVGVVIILAVAMASNRPTAQQVIPQGDDSVATLVQSCLQQSLEQAVIDYGAEPRWCYKDGVLAHFDDAYTRVSDLVRSNLQSCIDLTNRQNVEAGAPSVRLAFGTDGITAGLSFSPPLSVTTNTGKQRFTDFTADRGVRLRLIVTAAERLADDVDSVTLFERTRQMLEADDITARFTTLGDEHTLTVTDEHTGDAFTCKILLPPGQSTLNGLLPVFDSGTCVQAYAGLPSSCIVHALDPDSAYVDVVSLSPDVQVEQQGPYAAKLSFTAASALSELDIPLRLRDSENNFKDVTLTVQVVPLV